MRLGEPLELPYELRHALPAGRWHAELRGYQLTMDGTVQIDLIAGGRVIGSASMSNAAGVGDGGFPGDVDIPVDAEAYVPTCGERLVVKLTLTSGGSPYSNLYVTIQSP